ncbi:MAG: preprotein translocase subunit SecE [Alphaproteobacteria bacterium]|nr:MAG: preprotein translocase subunit SecE [Alphaproteobacteria bacterium]
MSKLTPAHFVRQVRQEMAKITWPTQKETSVSIIMVCVMAVISALYFALVDNTLMFVIGKVLGFGG